MEITVDGTLTLNCADIKNDVYYNYRVSKLYQKCSRGGKTVINCNNLIVSKESSIEATGRFIK